MSTMDRQKVSSWFWQPASRACEHVRFLISKSLDVKLSFQERLRLRMHLWRCHDCTHYRQNLQTMRQRIRDYCATHPQPENSHWRLSTEARSRMKRSIQEEIRRERNAGNHEPDAFRCPAVESSIRSFIQRPLIFSKRHRQDHCEKITASATLAYLETLN